jgi:antitoxin component YwqK of YwqJK toxin-antitoxin module
MKFRGVYVNGKEEGEHICYWENGQIAQQGHFQDGKCIGVWEDYHDDGTLQKRCLYKGSRNFDQTWFNPDGSVRDIYTFVNGIKQ